MHSVLFMAISTLPIFAQLRELWDMGDFLKMMSLSDDSGDTGWEFWAGDDGDKFKGFV